MNKINFHSIKNIKVPYELKQKVISIPESDVKPVKHPNHRIRSAAAAAIFIVISAICLTLLFNNGGKAPIELKPYIADGTTSPTEKNGAVPPTPYTPTDSSSASEATDTVRQIINGIFNQPTQPTQGGSSATSPPSVAPSQSASTKPDPSPTQSSDEKPTQASTQQTAQPTTQNPTEKSTDKPTQPTTQSPTDKPDPPIELPTVMPSEQTADPSEQTEYVPTQPTEPPEYMLCRQTIKRDLRVDSGTTVYCRVTSEDGTFVYGNSALYSTEHIATETGTVKQYGRTLVSYEYKPGDHGLVLKYDEWYSYSFYDSTGEILATGRFRNK